MASERTLTGVVVAYGVPRLLADCLASVEGRYPVIVVDNSSSADVRAVVAEAGATYVDPGCNVGFAAGVNVALRGLDLANTDVLLLNPDATIDAASIQALWVRLSANVGLACLAPQQRQHGSTVEDRVAWPFPTPLGAWIDAIGLGALRRRADFVIGAVLLLRGEALLEIGGFDERFFLYAEETDWQRRACQRGWTTAVAHGIWAEHVGAGTDDNVCRRELRFHTGAERYVRKYYGRVGWTLYRLANVVGASVRAAVLRGARRRAAAKRACIYACGPDRLARKAAVVPVPLPRVPDLSGHRRSTDAVVPSRVGKTPRQPLRILLDARDVGINQKGVGRVLEEVVPRLMQLEPARYVAVATSAARTRFAAIDSEHVRTVRLFPQSVWEQLALPSIAVRLHADAIYCHRECAAIWGPPVLLHVPEDPETRWESEGDPGVRERARRHYSRLMMDRALQRARVVTSTASARSDLVRRHGLCAGQISVVPLGVDLKSFAALGPVRDGTPYLFCLASDDPRDHCELVLEAFARFHSESNATVRLVIAGDLGKQTSRIADQSRRFGVGPLVDLPGRISDEHLSACYAGSLATIAASSNEGFGLQPLEALACGSLLIAARTPAVEEVTRGAVVLWADLEAGALAEAMTTVVRSPELREVAAKTNRAVAARFDWTTTASELHELLEEFALAGRGVRPRGRSLRRAGSLQP